MMINSVGEATKADTPPAAAAHPNLVMLDSSSPLCLASSVCSKNLFVPNWVAVMGAMLHALICSQPGSMAEAGTADMDCHKSKVALGGAHVFGKRRLVADSMRRAKKFPTESHRQCT